MTSSLHQQSRFETLVVGSANRLAATAARAVAEGPGAVYNPLFVYARPGLGKTHLLMAIGHAARAIDPRLTVEYMTLDDLVEAFHAAVASGNGEVYRRGFLDLGLLLIDDVQFLSQRREMQAEVLRLIDALQAAGRQIVLTSDRPPNDIESLDDRLIRRFAGGLVIDIGAPDYETRVAILRRRAEERGAAFAPGVLEAVATVDIDNVRELIGALNRIIAFQAISDQPLDPVQARLLIGGHDSLDVIRAEAVPDQGIDSAAVVNDAQASEPLAPAAPPADPQAAAPEHDIVGHLPIDVSAGEVRNAVAEPSDLPADRGDEFADFLSEVSATVLQQVESWRARVTEAVLRWEGEGYRVAPLEALLEADVPADPELALRSFEAEVERLRTIEAEVVAIAPELEAHPALRDPGDIPAALALLEQTRIGANPPPAPSPHWKLGDFLESASNRMAVRAAAAVVQEAGAKYNPLVIAGLGGTGKTHLLHGLGNALAAGGRVVACLGAHDFTDELIGAIDRDAVGLWRARYRGVDAFLLDDVHLLAGKERTQEELFLLFNLLLERGRQMVFTTAVPLPDLSGVEARLLTRLEGGLVVELPAPDRELRQRAIERLLAAKLDGVDPGLAAYIASRPAESMRSTLGLLQRVLNAAEVQQILPTATLARQVLEGTAVRAPRRAPPATRTSGIVAPLSGGVRSREKMVWEWPDIAARIIEEWR